MANQEHLDILKQGVEIWNQWRKEHAYKLVDLNKEELADSSPRELISDNTDLSEEDLNDTNSSFEDQDEDDLSDTNQIFEELNEEDLSEAVSNGVDLSTTGFASVNRNSGLVIGFSRINVNFVGMHHPDRSFADLSGIDLSKNDLAGIDLSYVDLSFTDLTNVDLSNANLYRAGLSGASLSSANLNGANLCEANLRGTDLNCANLRKADLSGADLFCANLGGADLSNANLREAQFTNVYVDGAYVGRSKVYVTNGNLFCTNLSGANLYRADLSGANLRGTDLSGANVEETDWTGVTIGWTRLVDLDLSTVQGLDTVNHEGPSTVGLDTIYHSYGLISEFFLRRAGIPDTFLTNMRALVASMSPIEFYSCFIAYSHRDEDFAKRLYADLQRESVRCWFAPEDLKIGDHYHERIDESIRVHDKLILILSERAVQSAWVEREVVAAREKEDRKQHPVLFPIRLDNSVMDTTKAWAADVRRRWHIGDFTQWKQHDAYQQAFKRLLRDLQAREKS